MKVKFNKKRHPMVRFYLVLLLLSVFNVAFAQDAKDTRTIKGSVSDEQGYKMPGITIRLKGTTTGTITNDTGAFAIQVPKSEKQPALLFSFVGYDTKEIIVGNTNTLAIIMTETSNLLNEAVVVGYGTVQKKDLTGSVGKVDVKDLNLAPIRSFDEALAGRIAGMQVVSEDGQPGGESNIVIRGTGTLSQNSGPLIVIDGFPQESSNFNNINPQDIESIEVLKDASSTAIYGARGANGVIILTTKKGKSAKPTINYNAFVGMQSPLKLMEMMDAYDFVRYQNDINPGFAAKTYFRDGKDLEYYRTAPSIDWQRLVIKPAEFHNHSLSLSGKSGKTNYFISGNYVDQKGMTIKSGFKRYQARLNLDQEVTEKLKVSVALNYSATKSYGNLASSQVQGVSSSNSGAANYALMYGLWSYRPVTGGDDLDSLINSVADDNSATLDQDRVNPYLATLHGVNNRLDNALSANGFLEYKLTKDFRFRASVGLNLVNGIREVFNNQYTRGGSPTTGQGASIGQNGNVSNSYGNGLLNENTLTYDKKFGKKNSLNIVAGFSTQSNNSSGNSFSAIMVPNPELGVSGLDQGIPYSVGASSSSNRAASAFGRLNYGFDSRYLMTATFRADGSSKFAPGHKWGYFPSGAVAWRFMNEKFMKRYNKILTDGKLRVSYGLTGNNRIGDFAAYSNITTPNNSRAYFNNSPIIGSAPGTIDNRDLTWETAGTFDVGLELSFLEGRANVEIDYYNKRTYDLLLGATISQSTGFSSTTQNIGDIENTGLELTLSTVNVRTKNFIWRSNFNIAFNRNRLLGLANNEWAKTTSVGFSSGWTFPLYLARIGYPIAQFYGLINEGLYQLSDFDQVRTGTTTTYILKENIAYQGTTRTTTKPGDIKFKDLDGDGVITVNDNTIIGNPFPIHIGGFSNNFTYKAFDLNVFLQWSYGNDVYNGNRNHFEGATTGDATRSLGINMFKEYADYWTINNQDAKYPNPIPGGIRFFSTRMVEDGSFLRLKTVSFGYSLPQGLLGKVKLGSARFSIAAQNIYTWTKYSGPDPEVSTRNTPLTPAFDFSPYPRARVITGNVNITF